MSTRLVECKQTGQAPRHVRRGAPVAEPRGGSPRPASAPYETKWGTGTVTVADGVLIAVELPGGAAGTTPAMALRSEAGDLPSPADQAALDRWVAEMEAYFRGEQLSWPPEQAQLERLGLGTFERRVYEALMRVPAGETISYGGLAEAAGYPRAARAVGNAMASNPLPLVIPCHRVIRSDGSMGNYGCDPTWKERLLNHERTV